MEQLIHQVAESAWVVSLREHFPSPATVEAPRQLDVIIVAVDRLQYPAAVHALGIGMGGDR